MSYGIHQYSVNICLDINAYLIIVLKTNPLMFSVWTLEFDHEIWVEVKTNMADKIVQSNNSLHYITYFSVYLVKVVGLNFCSDSLISSTIQKLNTSIFYKNYKYIWGFKFHFSSFFMGCIYHKIWCQQNFYYRVPIGNFFTKQNSMKFFPKFDKINGCNTSRFYCNTV